MTTENSISRHKQCALRYKFSLSMTSRCSLDLDMGTHLGRGFIPIPKGTLYPSLHSFPA